LGCCMAGEMNDRIFLWFLLTENRREKGPHLQNTFCTTANLFLNCWGKSFLFLLTVPVM
jgi:hypothetical protein